MVVTCLYCCWHVFINAYIYTRNDARYARSFLVVALRAQNSRYALECSRYALETHYALESRASCPKLALRAHF